MCPDNTDGDFDDCDISELLKYTDKNNQSKYLWGTLFSFGILLPISIPRSVNQLKFSSLFGVLCSMYLALAVLVIFFSNNKGLVPEPS